MNEWLISRSGHFNPEEELGLDYEFVWSQKPVFMICTRESSFALTVI